MENSDIGARGSRNWLLAAGALAAIAFAAPAKAAGPDAAPDPSCDFFQSELIGVFCGHTAYLGFTGQQTNATLNSTTGGVARHWTYQYDYESATAAVSPWQGVRVFGSTQEYQYDTHYNANVIGGPGGFSSKSSGDLGGWQILGAEGTLFDRQTATGRYVLDLVGEIQHWSGGGPVLSRDLQQFGWLSGARWELGGSGFALDYYSQTYLQRWDNPGEFRLSGLQRLLVANDAWGVAIGPRLTTDSVLWHGAGDNIGWSAYTLGAVAILEPFRNTRVPVLRDVTLNLSAAHSLGQANLVPSWQGASSSADYTAELRVNFRY